MAYTISVGTVFFSILLGKAKEDKFRSVIKFIKTLEITQEWNILWV